jgi:hypothetical protein
MFQDSQWKALAVIFSNKQLWQLSSQTNNFGSYLLKQTTTLQCVNLISQSLQALIYCYRISSDIATSNAFICNVWH